MIEQGLGHLIITSRVLIFSITPIAAVVVLHTYPHVTRQRQTLTIG